MIKYYLNIKYNFQKYLDTKFIELFLNPFLNTFLNTFKRNFYRTQNDFKFHEIQETPTCAMRWGRTSRRYESVLILVILFFKRKYS